ncbi:uncharacterized protein LOC142338475 [Convolutriloba macropyga]|uniref:uncharacterized protein LOC142338475 n=1 Tax=Convolutriloba macropyga TaxID=536237 RepID=UPI003F522A2D
MLRAGSLLPGQQAGLCRNLATCTRRNMSTSTASEARGEPEDSFLGLIEENSYPNRLSKRDSRSIISNTFGNINFVDRKSKSEVKNDIAMSLANPDDLRLASKAIRSCGGRWYDTNKVYKSNVLSRFMQTYLAKSKLSLGLGNAMLISYAENNKDFDSKSLLKSFMESEIQPSETTYSAIIRLEIARGNFQSAVEVFNFCKDQSLNVNNAGLLSLLMGSITNNNMELAALAESVLTEDDRYPVLASLAKALGHSKNNNLHGIEESLASTALNPEASLDEKVAMVQAGCLVYQNLVESKSSRKVTSDFLDMFANWDLSSNPVYDTNLGLTSAHLYANGFVEESFELKKSIPDDSPLLYGVKSSDTALMGAMINNNQDSVGTLMSTAKEAASIKKPMSVWFQLDSDYGHKASDVASVMEQYLENPDIGEVRPQFYFPFMVKTSKANPPAADILTAFHKCLNNQSDDVAVFSIHDLEQILVTNVHLLEHLLASDEVSSYPKSQCAVIRALIFQSRFYEAVQVAEKTHLDQNLATDLAELLVPLISRIYYPSVDVATLLVKTFEALSESSKMFYINRLFVYLAGTATTMPKVIRNAAVARYLNDKNIMVDEMPDGMQLPLTDDKIYARVFGDIVNVLQKPEVMLKPGKFSTNIDKLNEGEIEDMISKLSDGSCEITDENEKAAKRIILNAKLKRFEELDALLEGDQIKDVCKMHSTLCLLLDSLLDSDSFARAFSIMKQIRYGNDLDAYVRFLLRMQTEDDVELFLNEPWENFVSATNIGLTLGRLREILSPEKYRGALERLLDSRFQAYAAPALLEFEVKEFYEGKKTFEDVKATWERLSGQSSAANMRVFMIAACLKAPESELSKSCLKELLKTDGTQEKVEIISGDIIFANLHNGQYDQALELAANKISRLKRTGFNRLLRHSKDVELLRTLFKINGRVMPPLDGDEKSTSTPLSIPTALCYHLKNFYSNGSADDRVFVREVVEKVVSEDKPKIPTFAFPQLERLARLIGVKVPDDYQQRYAMHADTAVQNYVNKGDLEGAVNFIAKTNGDFECSALTLEALLRLSNLLNPEVITKKTMLQLLAKNANKLSSGRIVRDLVINQNWSPLQFESLVRVASASDSRDVYRKLLTASGFSFRRSLYFPRALVGYCSAYSQDMPYMRRQVATHVDKVGLNGAVFDLVVCTRIDPSKVNATEETHQKVLAMIMKELQKRSSSVEIETMLEDLSGRFKFSQEILDSVSGKLNTSANS